MRPISEAERTAIMRLVQIMVEAPTDETLIRARERLKGFVSGIALDVADAQGNFECSLTEWTVGPPA